MTATLMPKALKLERPPKRKKARAPPLAMSASRVGEPQETSVESTGSDSMHAALRKRAEEVNAGAGRRYRVATVVGFLNVHSTNDSPWRTDNVVHQLRDNQVVESTREEGAWVCHDGGGWSVREHGGHQFLVPLET